MKQKLYVLIIPLLIMTTITACGNSSASEDTTNNSNKNSNSEIISLSKDHWIIDSQDKSLKVDVKLTNGQIKYSVLKNNSTIVGESALGFDTDVVNFDDGLKFFNVKSDTKTISYNVLSGKKAKVTTTYNEKIIEFEKNNYILSLFVRSYDDGYAFKYSIDQKKPSGTEELILINNETTNYTLPEGTTTYMMPAKDYETRFCYEESYTRKKINKCYGVIASMPLLYETGDNYWSLISESQLVGSNYRGSFLEGTADSGFKVMPAYKSEKTMIASLPFNTPWRVGMVGDLATITESTLIEDLYDDIQYYRPDNYDTLTAEQKNIYDYSWVTPGKCGWTWLNKGSGTQQQWSDNKKFITNAAVRGYEWFLIDAGWVPSNTEAMTQFKDMMAHAKKLGVKMMCWAHSYNDLGTEEKQKNAIALWKSYGFEGIKVDFFDGLYDNTGTTKLGESQSTINLYDSLYKITADNQMILNIHGANKPTGERRQYPHVLTREGVRGNEYKLNVYSKDCVTIPYIRAAVGPSDYTPSLVPFDENTTVGSQAAMHVLYETGMLTMGDSPENYNAYSELSDLLSSLPALYDEVKFIDGSPLDSCIIARRKGTDWYIGGMACTARQMNVDLSKILSNGTYEATIFSDGATYLDIKNETKQVNKDTVLNIDIIKNGGFIIKLSKK